MRFMKRCQAVALMCGLAAVGARLEAAPAAGHAHAHPTEGPHHGGLIELGKEDYHAELVHDDATDTVTIHILDSSATKPVPITAKQLTLNMRTAGKPQQFTLSAQPQKGDAAGSASAFATTSKEICRAIDGSGASGRLNVEIGGKIYVGKVGGHSHNHKH
ncbi:MAG: hypothetical protein K8S94_01540 [Planctomycetia bacterium]|nr:hypothetical protein [Planctomycetia bacterium]